jgi:sugar phosphate permease
MNDAEPTADTAGARPRDRRKIRKIFKATNVVLGLLCVMYFITYIDRVNVGTAAGAIQKELGLSNTQLGLIFSGFAYP